jgi:hypothetical protein
LYPRKDITREPVPVPILGKIHQMKGEPDDDLGVLKYNEVKGKLIDVGNCLKVKYR